MDWVTEGVFSAPGAVSDLRCLRDRFREAVQVLCRVGGFGRRRENGALVAFQNLEPALNIASVPKIALHAMVGAEIGSTHAQT